MPGRERIFMQRWASARLAAAVCILALALRLALLDSKSLWIDEFYSLDRASQPAAHIIEDRQDPHPRGYYLFLHTWIQLGVSEFVLRLPSALFGVLAVWVLYVTGRALHSDRIALWAVGLLAIDPLHIWYSQEARMYAGVTALALIGVYFAWQLARRSRWIDWLGYVMAVTLSIYFDYMGLAVWALTIVAAVAALKKEFSCVSVSRRWWSAQAVVALLYLPEWTRFAESVPFLSESYTVKLLNEALARWGLVIPMQTLSSGLALVFALMLPLAAIGFGYAWRRMSARRVEWGELRRVQSLIMVFYALWLVLAAWPGLYSLKRQVIVCVPYFVLAVALAAHALRRMTSLRVLAVLAAGIACWTLVFVPREDWRPAAELVARESHPGDVILPSPRFVARAFGHYYRSDPGSRARLLTADVSVDEVAAQRVWLVAWEPYPVSPAEVSLRQALEQSRTVVSRWYLYRVTVVLLQ